MNIGQVNQAVSEDLKEFAVPTSSPGSVVGAPISHCDMGFHIRENPATEALGHRWEIGAGVLCTAGTNLDVVCLVSVVAVSVSANLRGRRKRRNEDTGDTY